MRNLARNTQIIARNQRALSEHSPDSAQISTVLEIGQSCRDSPPSSPLFSMQIMSVPFFSRSSLRIYRKSSGSQVVTTPKFKARIELLKRTNGNCQFQRKAAVLAL